jgi:hypothetical protein
MSKYINVWKLFKGGNYMRKYGTQVCQSFLGKLVKFVPRRNYLRTIVF